MEHQELDTEEIDETTATEYCTTLGFFVFVIGGTLYIVSFIINPDIFNALIPFSLILFIIAFIMICVPPFIGIFNVFLTGNGTYKEGAQNGYEQAYRCICSC